MKITFHPTQARRDRGESIKAGEICKINLRSRGCGGITAEAVSKILKTKENYAEFYLLIIDSRVSPTHSHSDSSVLRLTLRNELMQHAHESQNIFEYHEG